MRWRVTAAAALVAAALLTVAPSAQAYEAPQALRVRVLATYPHDPAAFTQGLEFSDGVLYEGTGLYGQSEIRTVTHTTGEVRSRVALPAEFFGEGVTVVDDQIWQLTWQEGVAIRRDRATLAEAGRATYEGEGWGLCHDEAGDRLIMSNGGSQLTFRNPTTFAPTGTVDVTLNGQPLLSINELECVGGNVWANIWQTDQIVRINPATGVVEATVDAAGLLTPEERARADVLNGIAAVPSCSGTFLITGKLWPKAFLVQFPRQRS